MGSGRLPESYFSILLTVLKMEKRGDGRSSSSGNMMRGVVWMVTMLCVVKVKGEVADIDIGALVAYESSVGRAAKTAIEMGVEDVNAFFNNTVFLRLHTIDTNCSSFLGTAAALEMLKRDVKAIIGPDSSGLARVVSAITNELHVPLLSFAATDPTLASGQYPYFLRTTHDDYNHMIAISKLISHYGWRTIAAIYVDNDYGRNGIMALNEALYSAGIKIAYKAALPPIANRSQITRALIKLSLIEARVVVVHVNPTMGLDLFAETKLLEMMNSGYVWIATDWLSLVIDSIEVDTELMNSLQGVITLRRHIPPSPKLLRFTSRWNAMLKAGKIEAGLNTYALSAYDAVWAVAYAIESFLSRHGNISFTKYTDISNKHVTTSELTSFNVFSGGPQLLEVLKQVNFVGLTGPVQLKDGKVQSVVMEIINIVGTGIRKVSYQSQEAGLSVYPPEAKRKDVGKRVHDIIWPGERKSVPQGWALPNNGKQLLIGVPKKTGFNEFVETSPGRSMMKGFCIDVFTAAMNLIPYPVSYTFDWFGNGTITPSYDALVDQVVLKKFDAVIGDITITTNRSQAVKFTQPYIESGLVMVTSTKEQSSSDVWAFLQPFSREMWLMTAAFFLIIGAVVWILEHRTNPEFRGPPKQQIVTLLWFSFSTLFFAHRENTMSALGRAVLIIWLFVVLIINSSYTASLTSIITVQQLSPAFNSIDSLRMSKLRIGYQAGSFAEDYLIRELNIDPSRLIPLDSIHKYAEALSLGPSKGGVAAVVDELPYAQLFTSIHCEFTIVGQSFTRTGWGFAFPKDSKLAKDTSTAILALSESGDLQRIHDKWLSPSGCISSNNQVSSNQLSLKSFRGLFLVSGVACLIALIVFLCRITNQFINHYRSSQSADDPLSAPGSFPIRSARVLRSFASFVDEREPQQKEKRLKRKRSKDVSQETGFSLSSPSSPPYLTP